MKVTRRYWTAVLLGGVLASSAPVVDSIVPLGGASVLWGWLLARQYTFIRGAQSVDERLETRLSVSDHTIVTDEEILVTVGATVDRVAEVAVEVVARLPTGATDRAPEARRLALVDEHRATTDFHVDWPIAGTFEVGPLDVSITDRYGLFALEYVREITDPVSVVPRSSQEIHVGEAGERISVVAGEHDVGRHGQGMEPLEIREYVPEDDARHIDWKATARMNQVHVREYEQKSTRTTLVVFDHREGLDTGPAGATEIDHLRHVALAFVDGAAEFADPIGLVGVGDGGTSVVHSPRADRGVYDRVKSLLREIAVSEERARRSQNKFHVGKQATRSYWSPERAQIAAEQLSGEDSRFSRNLRPYFDRPNAYVQRIEEDPMFRTVKSHAAKHSGGLWTVLLTDDTRRSELYESVKAARQGGNHVLVFLTPRSLYESTDVDRLDDLYEQYLDFEQYRRRLHRMERVSAFEVAPRDRIEDVLDGEQRGRKRAIQTATDATETVQYR